MPVVRDLRVLLRLRDFRRLLAVRLLSQGCRRRLPGRARHVRRLLPGEADLGRRRSPPPWLSCCCPYSLIGPFAGVLLDRWRRRQVFLHGNLLRAAAGRPHRRADACHASRTGCSTSPRCASRPSTASSWPGSRRRCPRVVDTERLVLANSLSPTAGTLAATVGGGLAFGVRLVVVGLATRPWSCWAPSLYLCAGLAALTMAPRPARTRPATGLPPAARRARRHGPRPRRGLAPSGRAPGARQASGRSRP